MRRFIVLVAALYLTAVGLLFSLAPDILSMVILGIMTLVLVFGFVTGIMRSLLYVGGFRRCRESIEKATEVQTDETWLAVFAIENIFGQNDLDTKFREYKAAVEQQKEEKETLSDIEEYINDEYLSICTWRTLNLQIPGTMTGLGILGTFIGLLTGIGFIEFSTVDAALESISVLLAGIRTAFYTSVAGVILSILFNMLDHTIWNIMMREYDLFIDTFHRLVFASTEDQERNKLNQGIKEIIQRLDRIPKRMGFSLSNSLGGEDRSYGSESLIMEQVLGGMQNNEFVFYLQPYVNLKTREIVRAEATVRWNHEILGTLPPSAFLTVLEKNGFITKLDSYIWESVCYTVRKWIDSGRRPIPISVNVSEMDIMAMDVAGFFDSMIAKYDIPPRAIDIEIAQGVYENNFQIVNDTACALRRSGFKVIVDEFDGDYISMNMLRGVEADELILDLEHARKHDSGFIEDVYEQSRKIGIELSAENIENAEQIALLSNTECQVGQGPYLYRPVSLEEFESSME